jgi:hypothetical protein
MLELLAVICAHYRCKQRPVVRDDWTLYLLRFIRWADGSPENGPCLSWPKWGRGYVAECPDCNVIFVNDNDRDHLKCYRCALEEWKGAA